MTPINNKSLLHFIFGQMDKLDKKEITTDEAKAQANLAKQANVSMKYELDRATVLMELDKYKRTSGADIGFRNVEGKNFE
jgi:hypothetical protein